MKIDTSLIPESAYIETIDFEDGDTADIITTVLSADKENSSGFCAFSRQFEANRAGLRELWEFTRHKIFYKTDEYGTQKVKVPPALWKVKQGDCKSKTLFINHVLRCLGIPYIIRFISQGSGDYTHVYTIAILDGKQIILDSVYDYFNAETGYLRKKDFNMTKISTIRGIIPDTNQYDRVGTADDPEVLELAEQLMELAQAQAIEIQQRKKYVTPAAPINYVGMTEGEALLEILKQRVKIIGVMKDAKNTDIALNMVQSAIRTGKIPTASNDENLIDLQARIGKYLTMNNPATGYGLRQAAFNYKKTKAFQQVDEISSFPYCMNNHWFVDQGGTGTPLDPYQYIKLTHCTPQTWAGLNNGAPPYKYFEYGRAMKAYRTKWDDSGALFRSIMEDLKIELGAGIGATTGTYNLYWFLNNNMIDLTNEALKQRMPVLSNWANDLFRADNTRTDGTVGTAMLYTFVPDLTQLAIQGVTPGDFPGIVTTKMVFQQQYMDSCTNFSTISTSVFKGLSENGIIFDFSETPDRILSAFLKEYNPGVADGGLSAAIIAGVIVIVGLIIDAVASNSNKGGADANALDSSAADTAQFRSQSQSTLFDELDFLTQTGGTGSGGGSGGGNNTNGKKDSSSMMPLALALAVFIIAKRNKNKNN